MMTSWGTSSPAGSLKRDGHSYIVKCCLDYETTLCPGRVSQLPT